MAETLLELETRLVQAKEARHRLLAGTQEVTVSLHGYGSTTYMAGNVEALEKYIHNLQTEIAKRSGTARLRVSWQAGCRCWDRQTATSCPNCQRWCRGRAT